MFTRRHEIIKGDQLDPDLGSCCVFIHVGLLNRHFEQQVFLFVDTDGLLFRPYIHIGISSTDV